MSKKDSKTDLKRIKEELKKNAIILVVVPHEKYLKFMIGLAKELAASQKQTCYVTSNRPYVALVRTFKDNKINVNKFFFIDAVTKSIGEDVKKIKNCVFVKSPYDLVGLAISISEALKKCNNLLFDSLSSLLLYEKPQNIMKFVHNIVNRIRVVGNVAAIFVILKGDVDAKLIKDFSMFIDDIIELQSRR